MIPKNNRLFVYGTLKSGFHNNKLLTEHGSIKCGGSFITEDKFLFVGFGRSFPGIVDVDIEGFPKVNVLGEVWWVSNDCLEALDKLESVPDLYYKKFIWCKEADSKNGYALSGANAYILNPNHLTKCFPIDGNCWCKENTLIGYQDGKSNPKST